MPPHVPSTRQVLPGARVNIVLKQDQPTGRTVVGVVADVLTRGNHPRGIKVRLADGRVGRVQSMATGGEKTSFIPTAEDAHYEDGGAGPSTLTHLFPRGPGGAPPPPGAVGLDAYIKPGKQRRRGRGKAGAGAGDAAERETEAAGEGPVGDVIEADTTTTCPVCGEFEGDEAAVAHHVASHFDD